MMGCFRVSKGKKKRSEQNMYVKRVNPQDHPPTALPEPPTQTRSLQSAPSSFRDRVKQQPNSSTNSRARALSAPSSLDTAEQDALSVDYEEQEGSKSRFGSMKERQTPNPIPLPLPAPQNASVMKKLGSFKVMNASGQHNISGPLPLPPALPPSIPSTSPQTLPIKGKVRNFSYEELATACNNFSAERCLSVGLSSTIYKASFGDDKHGSRKLDATGQKEFINEVNTLASLQHPSICKLLGFHAHEGSEWRMLVYERLYHGSLDLLLYGKSDHPLLDWNARMKVASCAAQGLTFLHDEGPFQAMFHEFSTRNIQIDKDFSAKLSGYGCISHIPETYISSTSVARTHPSVEIPEKGLLTPKSNVWSFGVVLLELLTGRRNLDIHQAKEEMNLVKWSWPYLSDDGKLSLIMDPQLKGWFPASAARQLADITQRCLQTDPSERPTMRTVAEHLKMIQQMKFSSRLPLQEPGSHVPRNMMRSPSLNGIITPGPQLSLSPSLTTRLSASQTSPLGIPHFMSPQNLSTVSGRI
uniref:Protein kinase domain-containing protein n=1 Tax=Daucus carota subsp. sativus TaxID=79200 RepID=A0A164SZ09_DAUCS